MDAWVQLHVQVRLGVHKPEGATRSGGAVYRILSPDAVRDGDEFLSGLRKLSPLRSSQEEKLMERVRGVSRSALVGTLGTAAAQGLAGGIGLAICGFPALFWGTVMAFASLIPLVGTAVVWIPACGYLVITGQHGMAAFLAIWCGVGVGSIDNFLRPVLMKGEAEMSTLWVFFAVLGGLQLFGLPGLVYGPLVFGLCAVLLYLYQLEFQEYLTKEAKDLDDGAEPIVGASR